MKYSQNQEEAVIFAATQGLGRPGYVLDIGANDGTTFSNSRALIERGWTGYFVEPDFEAFAKLAALYADDSAPHVLVNAAIDTDGGPALFMKSKDGGLVSTADVRCAEVWKTSLMRKYWVQRMTVPELVGLMPKGPDVISVDIEGRSFEVLNALPIKSWDAKVLVCEHDGRAVEIAAWAGGMGYRTADLNAENIVLVRRA